MLKGSLSSCGELGVGGFRGERDESIAAKEPESQLTWSCAAHLEITDQSNFHPQKIRRAKSQMT
jgi:hypothetical protein